MSRTWRVMLVAVLACTAALAMQLPAPSAETAKATRTIVSITFDDGSASQLSAARRLARHGMHGTFYVNSGRVGSTPYYLKWRQIRRIAAAGNEIAGHSTDDLPLTTMNATSARREICGDRRHLMRRGYSPKSFAYPNGDVTEAIETMVKSCGYQSGRSVGNINSITQCTTCPFAESTPPEDAYRLRTPEGVTSTTTLADLEKYVTNAESNGGGWVILEFYGICDNSCTGEHSLGVAEFRTFLNWLRPRSDRGTVVRTVGTVIATN